MGSVDEVVVVVVVDVGEGEVRKTYPKSLCCSNSREPRSEDGELHDEYMRCISCFVCLLDLVSID